MKRNFIGPGVVDVPPPPKLVLPPKARVEPAATVPADGDGHEPAVAEAPRPRVPAEALRRLRRLAAGLAVAALGVALLAAATAGEPGAPAAAERSRPAPGAAAAAPARHVPPLRLERGAVHDYDPIGGDGESPDLVGALVDRHPGTTWKTENYERGALPKAGIGVYVDAGPRSRARAIEIVTPTPGWDAEVYGARSGPPGTLPHLGWTKLSEHRDLGRRTGIPLRDAPGRHRFYLLWIVKLPRDMRRVEIGELRLLDCRGALSRKIPACA